MPTKAEKMAKCTMAEGDSHCDTDTDSDDCLIDLGKMKKPSGKRSKSQIKKKKLFDDSEFCDVVNESGLCSPDSSIDCNSGFNTKDMKKELKKATKRRKQLMKECQKKAKEILKQFKASENQRRKKEKARMKAAQRAEKAEDRDRKKCRNQRKKCDQKKEKVKQAKQKMKLKTLKEKLKLKCAQYDFGTDAGDSEC